MGAGGACEGEEANQLALNNPRLTPPELLAERMKPPGRARSAQDMSYSPTERKAPVARLAREVTEVSWGL